MANSSILMCGPRGFDKRAFVNKVCSNECINTELNGVVQCLTDSQSGLTLENVHIETKYYSVDVDVFIDEPDIDTIEGYKTWIDELMSDEMRELRDHVQCIIIILPDWYTENELDTINIVGDHLADLLDSEHKSSHNTHLLWDGDLYLTRIDHNNLTEEAKNCQRNIQCVEWRDMLLKTLAAGNATAASSSASVEVHVQQMQSALNAFNAARDKLKRSGDKEVSPEIKQQVESLLDALLN
jgi:hypothetical protein